MLPADSDIGHWRAMSFAAISSGTVLICIRSALAIRKPWILASVQVNRSTRSLLKFNDWLWCVTLFSNERNFKFHRKLNHSNRSAHRFFDLNVISKDRKISIILKKLQEDPSTISQATALSRPTSQSESFAQPAQVPSWCSKCSLRVLSPNALSERSLN